ncbi:MAG: 16S rRNA (adenine(1518)-N(6)/adenine(1519)-N(6))-dimethyltransferase RsmA [Gammaproteobacteria bacterium]|nr:16S rRNA (adenine(1518)-N(6)/adenine(1519)-N(6))-dimethyltransferase RsmA [Gammaproteobacteria bacterium]
MRPRKSLGQHFLHDPKIIAKIIAAIEPQPGEHFVEIGPGRGALTFPLLARVGKLDVIEVDSLLAAELERRAVSPALVVHRADALGFDFTRLATGPASLRLASNLPYNISTPLLFHLLAQQQIFRDLHVMLQREVVERMTAQPGTRAYGRLTVALAARCRVQSLFIVRPGAFNPPPRVDSAIARLVPDRQLAARITDQSAFDKVLTRAFSMRRKRLANALKGLLTPAEINACGIDPDLRPDAVAPEGYIALAARLARGLNETVAC